MRIEDQSILFFSRSTQHGGTENVIVMLCEIFSPIAKKIVVVSADGFAVDKLKALGIKHYVIPDIENKSPGTLLSVLNALKEIVNKEQITVIHTHHRMAAFYVKLSGLDRRCVFVNTSHNIFTNKRALTRFSYKGAKLVACGEMVKKSLEDVYGLKEVAVIRNAVKSFNSGVVIDDTIDQAKQDGKYAIGNIGRLSEQKGMEYYVRSIPCVLSKHPHIWFCIIGSGEDEEKLRDMCKGLPVAFMGYRKDIQNLMSQLDLIVLSSLWEGLPLTPIEAFSVGKTIVATGVDGTPEIVEDRHNGLLVEPRNPEALADGICWMIEHPQEKKQMELMARETYEQKFSFERFSQSYIDYYRSL